MFKLTHILGALLSATNDICVLHVCIPQGDAVRTALSLLATSLEDMQLAAQALLCFSVVPERAVAAAKGISVADARAEEASTMARWVEGSAMQFCSRS